MKTLWNKWNDISLIKRILVFLIIGAILPNMDGTSPIAGITILGSLFVGALKAVAPILVFFLVIAALANAHADGSMKTIIIMYVFGTFISALVAVIASQLFPIELTLSGVEAAEKAAPSGITEVLETLLMNVVANPVDSLANANYLGILAWGILIGVALRAATEATKAVFTNISDAIATVVRWIISFAPFGIFGLVYDAVSTNGIEIFTEYGLLLAVLVGCMFFVALVAYPIMIGGIAKTNPYPLVLRCLRESGLTAFFTRSSAANIPVNMTLCQKLHLNKDTYGVSIPLGATINMGGAAITITVMTLACVNTLGMEVPLAMKVLLSFVAAISACGASGAVSACGASGVAGGSLLLIPLACSLFGIPNDIAMQVVGVGFIIGVIQDSCETALNSASDVMFTAASEFRNMAKAGQAVDPKTWDK